MSASQLSVFVQGQGSLSADQLNALERTCDDYDDLRGFIGQNGVQVHIRGGAAVNDGGQGSFYWNASSTASDNGFSVIVPNGAVQGAWLRLSQDVGPWLVTSTSYANDAAAATGGVPVGGLYRNGSSVSIRVS